MKITVIAVGKIKEKYMQEAVKEYSKRLGKYCKLEIIQVEDEKTPDKAGEAMDNRIKDKEAGRILKYMKEDAYVISLAIKGKKVSSEELAAHLERLGIQGVGHIQFVIGGSLGLHESISSRADMELSFSDMTFPHQLMRVILLEQIYRSFRINTGQPYHK